MANLKNTGKKSKAQSMGMHDRSFNWKNSTEIF